jgi:hypothetical protein
MALRKVAVERNVVLWRCARWRCSAKSFYGVAQGGGAAQRVFQVVRKVAVERNVVFRCGARWRCCAKSFYGVAQDGGGEYLPRGSSL